MLTTARSMTTAVALLLAWAATTATRAPGAGAPARPEEYRGRRLPPAIVAQVEQEIRRELEAQRIPGLSAAIVAGKRVRWAGGFGLADLENQVPATARTAYRLGSICKPITAVAALQLAEDGRLDLDAPIRRYAPEFPEKRWPVTARQLLAHLGGIRHYKGDEIHSARKYTDLIGPLHIFKDDPLFHEPGTKYLYTTYGFNLLGRAVEVAAGRPFMEQLSARILRPAAMDRLRVDDPDAIIPHRAQGYRLTPDGQLLNSRPVDTTNKVPGGGMIGTVVDLARFASALMRDRLLTPETREQMWTEQSTRDGEPVGYGLGWSLGESAGRREAYHTGGQPRVSTLLYLRPDDGTAVALMSNLEGARLLDLARTLADLAETRNNQPQDMTTERPRPILPPPAPPSLSRGPDGR